MLDIISWPLVLLRSLAVISPKITAKGVDSTRHQRKPGNPPIFKWVTISMANCPAIAPITNPKLSPRPAITGKTSARTMNEFLVILVRSVFTMNTAGSLEK